LEKMAPLWEALIPKNGFPDVEFTFDPDDRHYDFLVIYEDLPPRDGERKILRSEKLACPKQHTLLITTEPSSIRIDGLNYLSQFGEIWTSRSFDWETIFKLDALGCRINNLPNSLPPMHQARRNIVRNYRWFPHHPPPLRWFYGRDMEGDNHLTLEQIGTENPRKTLDLSTVTSNKNMAHTVHAKRLEFSHALKARMGEDLHLFGRGFNAVRDKREAMQNYKYHIAIENHLQPGHHTEKLTDCFLALSLPFYFGDPNYANLYPREAVIPIDIFDLEKSETIIREAIQSNQYEKRLQDLRKAKHIAMSVSNPLIKARQWVHRIETDPEISPIETVTGVIHGRHAFRKAHPIKALQDLLYRLKMQRHPTSSPLKFSARAK